MWVEIDAGHFRHAKAAVDEQPDHGFIAALAKASALAGTDERTELIISEHRHVAGGSGLSMTIPASGSAVENVFGEQPIDEAP